MDGDGSSSSTIRIRRAAPAWSRMLADAEGLCRGAVEATLAQVAAPAWLRTAEVGILLTDDREARALNHAWRGLDRPTNVLSFPTFDLDPEALPEAPPWPQAGLGDIVLALETVRREAAGGGRSLEAHVCHLVVHATLHLLGFDHEAEPAAERMEALEGVILNGFGIADPYARAEPASRLEPVS
jgi:probable rRNA maturation factor